MRATGFTHVSIGARDVEESARFYKDFFGMEEVPVPEFSGPVRWLRVGGLQLHLFHDEGPAPVGHHFALDVDDFEEAFRQAAEAGVRVEGGNYSTVRELPDGAVQMYLRAPAGNPRGCGWGAGTARASGSCPAGRCRCTCATRRGTWWRSTGATSARSTGQL